MENRESRIKYKEKAPLFFIFILNAEFSILHSNLKNPLDNVLLKFYHF